MRRFTFALTMLLLAVAWPCAAQEGQDTQGKSQGLRVVDLQRLWNTTRSDRPGILREVREKGTAYELAITGTKRAFDDSVQRELTKIGFNPDEIQAITWIGMKRSVYIEGDPIPWDALGGPAATIESSLEAKAVKPADCTPGYVLSSKERLDLEAKAKRAVGEAGKLERAVFARFTLHGGKGAVASLRPLLNEINNQVAERFPKPLANVTNAQTLHVLVASDTKDYADACSAFSRQMRYPRAFHSPKAFKEGMVWFTKHLVVINLERCKSVEQVGRLAAYGIGRSIFDQYIGEGAPYPLSIGLGSTVEAMAYGSPRVSIGEHVAFVESEDWTDVLKKLKRRHKTIDTPIFLARAYEQGMSDGKYLGVREYFWALTEHLLKEPDKYAKAMQLMHHGLLRPADAIRWVYEADFPAINQAWAEPDKEAGEDDDKRDKKDKKDKKKRNDKKKRDKK